MDFAQTLDPSKLVLAGTVCTGQLCSTGLRLTQHIPGSFFHPFNWGIPPVQSPNFSLWMLCPGGHTGGPVIASCECLIDIIFGIRFN